ncbi:MAG: GNAT family N-acetyltransferase [Lachnospiraceae bacterium]|nr:GNAT family N-acetyltransferase [Lachnospiraceae bacterium]
MERKECNLLEYAVRYQAMMDEQAGFFARIAIRNGGKLLVYLEEGGPVGAAVLNIYEEGFYDLAYLFIRPEFRGRGYAGCVMRDCTEYAKKMGRGLTARVLAEREDSEQLRHLAKGAGLVLSGTTVMFHSYPRNEEDKKRWKEFFEEKGRRICEHMEKKGYITSDFASAPDRILDGLKADAGKSFPEYLNPFAMITPRDDEFSFLTWKDGVVVAYSAATSYGEGREKKIALEMMANRYGMMRSGIFFPALTAFINRTIERECARVTYTVYDSNQDMLRLTDGFLKETIRESSRQEIWRI